MNNSWAMEQHFERAKNIQASIITIFVCGSIFLIFFFIRWGMPTIEKPLLTEGIEVNLGNSDFGSGDVQPLVPGEPAPDANPDNSNSTPATSSNSNTDEKADSEEEDAVPAKTETKPVVKPTVTNTNSKPTTKPTTTTTPATPKNKAVMPAYSGGKGKGGNNADSYNGSKSEGDDKNGTGDKGKPWGSVDGKVYNGPGGTKMYGNLGKRGIKVFPSMNDDFDEDAKVAVDIVADANGNVLEARINPKGTSATQPKTKQAALRKAREIKFNPGTETQTGTIILDMRVRG